MGSVNRWIGIGNLGADVELKYAPSGKAVANLSIACNETWKDKDGTKKEKVEWVRCQVWGDVAENCAKYLSKGRQVYVEGRLQTRSYDKDGHKHYMTEVVADRVVFLGGGDGEKREGGKNADSRRGGGKAPEPTGDTTGQPPIDDDSIPF
jgi:single-strand DNA-binding protein